MGKFVKVATVEEIPPGQGKQVEVQGRSIALFHVGEVFYAIDNTCTHAGGPLAEGTLEGEEVECPWHGARFSIKTGEALTPPAGEPATAYKVQVNGANIEIEL